MTDLKTLLCPVFLPGYSVFQISVGGPERIGEIARLGRLVSPVAVVEDEHSPSVHSSAFPPGVLCRGPGVSEFSSSHDSEVAPTLSSIVPGFSQGFHLPPAFCHTLPPGIILAVKWPCRRECELTVFHCSSSNFSYANVQPSALYLKSNG